MPGPKGLKARILRDMSFVSQEVRGKLDTLVAGTILDVVPPTLADISEAALDSHERAAVAGWLTKRNPSSIIVLWNGRMRYVSLGIDAEYSNPTAAAPIKTANREPPAWAKLKKDNT